MPEKPLPRLLEILRIFFVDNVIQLYYIAVAMKPSEVPAIIPFRPTPEDRELIAELIKIRKPRKMSFLIRDGLKELLAKAKSQQK